MRVRQEDDYEEDEEAKERKIKEGRLYFYLVTIEYQSLVKPEKGRRNTARETEGETERARGRPVLINQRKKKEMKM